MDSLSIIGEASGWLIVGLLPVTVALPYVLRGAERLRLRKAHFRIMLGLVATGLVHIALNGAAVRAVAGS